MSDILKQITIPTPCHANWDSMTGDDRTRFCQECGKSVVNLAALTETEAASLVTEQGHELCAQVTRRKDGSVFTAKPHARFGIGWFMIVIAFIAVIFSFIRTMSLKPSYTTFGRVMMLPSPSDVDGDPSDDPDCDPEEEM